MSVDQEIVSGLRSFVRLGLSREEIADVFGSVFSCDEMIDIEYAAKFACAKKKMDFLARVQQGEVEGMIFFDDLDAANRFVRDKIKNKDDAGFRFRSKKIYSAPYWRTKSLNSAADFIYRLEQNENCIYVIYGRMSVAEDAESHDDMFKDTYNGPNGLSGFFVTMVYKESSENKLKREAREERERKSKLRLLKKLKKELGVK